MRFTTIIFPKVSRTKIGFLFVGEKGWAVLTKDKMIMRRDLERKALLEAGVAAFVLRGRDMRAEEMAEAFKLALPRMMRILSNYSRPLICTVTKAGRICVQEGQRRGAVRRETSDDR